MRWADSGRSFILLFPRYSLILYGVLVRTASALQSPLHAPEIGQNGQEKLARARVFMVGAGGLGSPVGYYLAAAGVGTLGIIDHDVVDLTNLQRQIAHSTPAVGNAESAFRQDNVRETQPDVTVNAISDQLLPESVEDYIRGYDIVVDCSDNFATRFW